MIINEPIDLFPWPSNIKYQHLTLSCANHNTKLASKASCIQGDLCQSISFIGKSELLTVCKTFVCSLMEYCFLLWAVAPVSHLSVLDSVESKVLKKIGFFHDEAEAQCVLLSHCRLVSGLFIFCNLFSNIAPSALSFLWPFPAIPQYTCSSINPLIVKHNSFIPCFSSPWNCIPGTVLSHPSLPALKHAVQHLIV